MTNSTLASFSDAIAAVAAVGGASVVQVSGARRPASGVVHGADTVVTTARALGREDGLLVRLPDNTEAAASLAGWDPASGIAVLKTHAPLNASAPALAGDARTGEFVLALARSWNNHVSASTGNVAVVGGPLRTERRQKIEQVIRITAPMHDGFAGGGVFGAGGQLLGIATAGEIRGFGVVIPAAIAWAAVQRVLTSGTPKRGFVGVAVQPVTLAPAQRAGGHEHALLVLAVTAGSPAEAAGILVGDIILELDGRRTDSSEQLLDALGGDRVGQSVPARVLRGDTPREVRLTVAARS